MGSSFLPFLFCLAFLQACSALLILPKLPYDYNALSPFLNQQTLTIHHTKHHAKYVDVANQLLKGTAMEEMDDVQVLRAAFLSNNSGLFNNAAQAFNHAFYWKSMTPNGGGRPTGALSELIDKSFGSYENFAAEFREASLTQFGSGWAWLVHTSSPDTGVKLKVLKTSGAGCPLVEAGVTPLLTLDVWEHAYYLDFQNMRATYADAFLQHLVNWDFAASNLPAESCSSAE